MKDMASRKWQRGECWDGPQNPQKLQVTLRKCAKEKIRKHVVRKTMSYKCLRLIIFS